MKLHFCGKILKIKKIILQKSTKENILSQIFFLMLISPMEEICVQNGKDTPQTNAEVVCKAELSFVPDVSVVLIACNTAKYLRQAMETLLCQTLKSIEIICVNDGSTDGTLELMKEYASKDERITILNHKQNFGAAVARNAGLAAAQGKYLLFVDSDDFFEPDMCEKMYKQAQKDESDVVIAGHFFNAKERDYKQKHYVRKLLKASAFNPLKFSKDLFVLVSPNTWTKLFKTELVRQKQVFFENLESCNDYTFSYTMLAASNKISIMKTPFVHYRTKTGTNISSNRGDKATCILYAIMCLKRNLKRLGIDKQYEKSMQKSALKCMKGELKHCSPAQKKDFFEQMPVVLDNDLFCCLKKKIHPFGFGLLSRFLNCIHKKTLCTLSESQENLIEPVNLKMPQISVIVPVYNVEKYLKRCLNSILAQTFADFELICVNDGSTDTSLKILEEFAAKDKRIKIISQQNQGISVARNNGFKIARGRWCFFIDSDDAIAPQTFEICNHFAGRYDADLVCFRFEKSDTNAYNTAHIKIEDIPFKTTDNPLSLSLSKSRFRIPFSACTKFYKTSAIQDIPFLEHINFEDCAHTYAFLSRHPKTVILDAALYFYTQNPSSVSNLKASENQLLYYRKVMLYLDEIYRNSTHAHDLKIIYRKLYPKLLNNQYKCCRNAEKQEKHKMLSLFAQSLKTYQQRRMISFSGCGLFKYLRYRRIAQKY